MHYLGLALYAEGRTDQRFLGPILRRLCGQVCAESPRPVEINDEILMLSDTQESKTERRAERVLSAARHAQGAWSLLFVHADADGDAIKARQERVQPALDRLRGAFDQRVCQSVAVIPVQTTESWLVCDGAALRQALGTTLDDKALGLPASAKAAERLADPKACLEAAFRASHAGGRRRPLATVHARLGALGEQVALHRLRQLVAFQGLESELRQALQAMGVLDPT
ncbi:DUF4276 family protein [Xylophilus sp. ASV27]|uniref:DUF4276 family protein n=1 Tax=Xylophilus sp. ASV27 TaxID=2795129 RepID=UPI0018EE3E8A|nr:DUF4276 family protein [Xylophilus sp. ASV27]